MYNAVSSKYAIINLRLDPFNNVLQIELLSITFQLHFNYILITFNYIQN